MGMYTALHLGVELKLDTPPEVIEVLRAMVDGRGELIRNPPSHPLFGDTRWTWMLVSDSFYFNHETHSELVRHHDGGHSLSITCNLKNYDDEIGKFLDWIMPHVEAEPGAWLGYYMYEEDERPSLIFYPGDQGRKS